MTQGEFDSFHDRLHVHDDVCSLPWWVCECRAGETLRGEWFAMGGSPDHLPFVKCEAGARREIN